MKRVFQCHLRGKRLTAALTIVLLSISQFAVAMHACSPKKISSSVAVITHHAMESGRDCDCPSENVSSTGGDAVLCKQHCESGHQNLAKPFAADQISFFAFFSVPIVTQVKIQRARSLRPADRVATSPPFLRNATLRI
ncbi:MAG: hypothetical protein ACKO1K_02970 [Burkholderiales bacterium]